MHLLYTIADLQPESGGPSRSVAALAAAVAAQAKSLDVSVFSAPPRDPFLEVSVIALDYGSQASKPMLPKPPVHTTLVPCRGVLGRKLKFSSAFSAKLLAALAEAPTHQPPTSDLRSPFSSLHSSSVIHDNGLWLPTNHAAAKVARATGVRFIISPRGMLTTWSLKFHGPKKRIAWHLFQRRDLQSAHVLHATSREEADGFRALGLTQPIAIIPNGVELPGEGGRQRSEVRVQREAERCQPEIPNHRTTEPPPPRRAVAPRSPLPAPSFPSSVHTALFLSRIHPKKGLLDLVQAWQTVRPQGWRMVIAGGDENGHLAEIKSEVGRQKLEKEFTFLGEIRDEAKWDLYRSADVFVLPTKSENFGIVIAEALASGVPVITTKGTPWEELQTHRCGWWVDPNAGAVAGALREACALSAAERSAMGERGRALIESKYTWPAAANQMLAVYRWMLGEAEQPACIQL